MKKRGIVIASHPGGLTPLTTLLRSLATCRRQIHVVINNCPEDETLGIHDQLMQIDLIRPLWMFFNEEPGYELGAFQTILEHTDLDEFLFLQDTFEVKDASFIDVIFRRKESVALGPTFFHYAGKWKRSVLEQMHIPTILNKADSIHWEHTFSRLYWEREPVWVFDPNFHDGEHQGFVEAFGRRNMLLENEFYIKRKGTWG